jgi:acetolactate synthase-1/2/3 large subunit
MDVPPVLATVGDTVLYVDLNSGTYRPFLPYVGNPASTRDHLFLLRYTFEQARLEMYDRQGIVWIRRLKDCIDSHGIVVMGNDPSSGFAVCSTGMNQIIYLDGDGREVRRWSPDPAAEFDSWHLNSLTVAEGRLYATCFGRFAQFRGWSGHVPNSGMILDVEKRQAVVEGLSAPHDPYRLDGGWLVNDSDRSRLLFVPDRGTPKVVVEAPGFSRGLAVLPDHFVVGFSSPRQKSRADDKGAILLIDRRSYRLLKTIVVPYREIGWICAAPDPEVIAAIEVDRHQVRESLAMQPRRVVVGAEDRRGAVEIVEPPRRAESGGGWMMRVRVSNQGNQAWSSITAPPVHLAYQVLDHKGTIILADGQRTSLPVPVYPGKRLTFAVNVHIPSFGLLPSTSQLRFTLVQETIAWWDETGAWKPVTIPLPHA